MWFVLACVIYATLGSHAAGDDDYVLVATAEDHLMEGGGAYDLEEHIKVRVRCSN